MVSLHQNVTDYVNEGMEGEIARGECGIVRIDLADLTAVDSTLTYTFSDEFKTWRNLTNLFTVELDFGDWKYLGNRELLISI